MSNDNKTELNDKTDLSRGDLFLMMKSYENTIKLNTTILSQLEKISEQHLLVVEDIRHCSDLMEKMFDKFANQSERINNVNSSVSAVNTSVSSEADSVKSSIIQHCLDLSLTLNKEVSSIKIRLIFVYAGIISVILGLVGILSMLLST